MLLAFGFVRLASEELLELLPVVLTTLIGVLFNGFMDASMSPNFEASRDGQGCFWCLVALRALPFLLVGWLVLASVGLFYRVRVSS